MKSIVEWIKFLLAKEPHIRKLLDEKYYFLERSLVLEQFKEKYDSLRANNGLLPDSIDIMLNRKESRYLQPMFGGELVDRSFLYESTEGYLVALLPIDLVYTEKQADAVHQITDVTPAWLEQNFLNEDKSIFKLTPHVSLFRFFRDGTEKPYRYLDWYRMLFNSRNLTPPVDDSCLLEKTYKSYLYMQHQLSTRGLAFFIDHPAVAVWNPRGYFNLRDGHHRTVFLMESGVKYVPAQISSQDYLKWRNDEQAQNLLSIIKETAYSEFYTPIHNPFYLDYRSCRDNANKSRIAHIMYAMRNVTIRNKRVLDIGANSCFISQQFYRDGADVTSLEPDCRHIVIARELQKLLYTDVKIINLGFEDYNTSETYDIGIMLTVFYHFFHKTDVCDVFIENLNRYINTILIWESGDQIEEEKQYILTHSKFKYYTHVANTYGTGKVRELGIFAISPHVLS